MELPRIFKTEDEKLSDQTVQLRRELLEVQAEWPGIEAQIRKIADRCLELWPIAKAAVEVAHPDAKKFAEELDTEMKKKASLKEVHAKKVGEIGNRLERSNQQIRVNYNAEFRDLAGSSDKLKRVRRLDSVEMSRSKGAGAHNYYEIEVATNLDAIDKRRDLALKAATAILNMRDCSIPEIKAAAEDWMNRIGAVNIAEMVTEQVPLRVADEMEGRNLPKFGELEDAHLITALSDRVSKLEKGKKP